MKATIDGIVLDGTPSEIAEYQVIIQKNSVQSIPPIIIPKTEELKEVVHVRPCGQRYITPSTKRKGGANNKYGPGGQKVWTISMLNGTKIEYKNQTVCAKHLGVNQTKISKIKDTGKAINGYYITTKHP